MENKGDGKTLRKLDLDQLENVNGGTYQEAMDYLFEVARGHCWDPRDRTYTIKHMSDEEYAKYEYLLDN